MDEKCKECKYIKSEEIKGFTFWFCYSPKLKTRELLVEDDLDRYQDTCINIGDSGTMSLPKWLIDLLPTYIVIIIIALLIYFVLPELAKIGAKSDAMSEYPITTDQIQQIIYLMWFAIASYLVGHILKVVEARYKAKEIKKETKEINVIEKLRNWWKKRKENKIVY